MKLVLLATLLLAQAPSSGPMTDADYCAALSGLYLRYVGGDTESTSFRTRRNDVEARLALDQCRAGNTASAIPVLERKLGNARISLPKRG